MITNSTMKNCASYDSDGVKLEDCDKINFVYGHNGSGKSTISNYLSDRTVARYNDCCVEFENPDFENEGFARCKLKFDKWHDFDF